VLCTPAWCNVQSRFSLHSISSFVFKKTVGMAADTQAASGSASLQADAGAGRPAISNSPSVPVSGSAHNVVRSGAGVTAALAAIASDAAPVATQGLGAGVPRITENRLGSVTGISAHNSASAPPKDWLEEQPHRLPPPHVAPRSCQLGDWVLRVLITHRPFPCAAGSIVCNQ
jgi:hypothetical protein